MSDQIHVPGRHRSEPNPLTVLAVSLDRATSHLSMIANTLSAIAVNTAKEARHTYAIEERDVGVWGTYCLACSDAEEAYVYPCKLGEKLAPPSHISVLPDLKTD